MSIDKRSGLNRQTGVSLGQGILMAKVVGVLDPTFMGKLKVILMKEQGQTPGEETQTYAVTYASPFFGQTPIQGLGNNNYDFNDTQKSYGMWFVPPDIGVTVLCSFIDGDPARGYWFACVPPSFANNMVPAIAGTKNVDYGDGVTKSGSQERRATYNTTKPLPVGEINKLFNNRLSEINPDNIKKPIHPIADRFLRQGTLEDDVRGTSTSSARRNVPNMVFGISTPGPLDYRNNSKRQLIGTKGYQSQTEVPISRLGGTQFVMDDGDDRFQRKTPAGVGPVVYADVIAGEKGDPTVPYNEYTRLRTRTGHQLLLHNSEDLIYISNSRGTAWIELTSNGKIDIYAADSISIHSEADVNIRADRDINLEAGRNFNTKAISGRVQVESGTDTNLIIGANGKITTGANFDLNTTLANKFTAGATTDIYSVGNHTETASQIHMNGPLAAPAQPATRLSTHKNPATDGSLDWGTLRYQAGTITSIIKRIPMHEPWTLHENNAPQQLTPSDLDRETATGD